MTHPLFTRFVWLLTLCLTWLAFTACQPAEADPFPTIFSEITPTVSQLEPDLPTALPPTNTPEPPLPTPTPPAVACPAEPLSLPVATRSNPYSVAYLRDRNVWIWTELNGETQQLTSSGDVVNVQFSPDGLALAFERVTAETGSSSLWVISTTGENERELLSSEQLLAMAYEDPAVSRRWADAPEGDESIGQIPSAGFNYWQWMPNSTQIMFSVDPGSHGMVAADDIKYSEVRLLEISSGATSFILPYGQGGLISFAPTQDMMLVHIPTIHRLVQFDGQMAAEYTQLPEPVYMGDGAYFGQPYWSQDGQNFLRFFEDTVTGRPQVWVFHRDGSPTDLITLSTPIYNFYGATPDLSQMAYVKQIDQVQTLYVADVANSWSVPYANTAGQFGDFAWLPNGPQFVYSVGENQQSSLWLGQLCQAPQVIPSLPAGIYENLQILDNNRFMVKYAPSADQPFALWLVSTTGEKTVIAEQVDSYSTEDIH